MYGENAGLLRDSLRELLSQHRIQQRIGGAGTYTVPATTTVDERGELGQLIGRYRQSVLVWCHQAIRAASPSFDLSGTTSRSRGPAEELRLRLDATIEASTVTLPTMEELTTSQPFPMVDLWRRAARACVLGEHDFGAGVDYVHLSEAQRLTVVHDAAEITRALVALDRRYANIPGWQHLKEPGRLGRAAEVCAAYSGAGEPDHTVDLHGWKPPTQPLDGPAQPGLAGVLQAQQNLMIQLRAFPDARSLRVVIDAQRVVSVEAARRLGDTDAGLAARWERRADTYGRLVHETRDLGGMIGNGGPAACHGSVAASRMQKLPPDALADADQVRQLERTSAGIDQRICDALHRGIRERLYFQRVIGPDMSNHDGKLVRVMRPRWLPVTGPARHELLDIIRNELRPSPVKRKPPEGAAQNRLDFGAAIHHRPGDPGPSLSA